jgi:hypothetical protein
MAVVSFKEIADGAGAQSSGPEESSITRVFRVTCDSKYDNALSIQPSMPIDYGTTLTGYPNFVCQSVNYDREHIGPSFSTHILTYEFRTTAVDQEKLDRQQFPNPLDRRARVTVRSVRYGELKITDKNGEVKRTSAGEIYPAKEVDANRWTIHVRKNYTVIPDFIWTYQNKLNDSTITVKGRTLEPETVKFGDVVVPELVKENGVEHYPVEFELDYRRDGWKDKRVDAGFYYLDGTTLKRIKDGEEEPVVVEEWLDGTGGKLRDIISNPQPGDETINEFDDYETADFSILPLNES